MAIESTAIIRHGDAAFGLEDTFRIGNEIYVLNEEAAFNLIVILGYIGYYTDIHENIEREADRNPHSNENPYCLEYSASRYDEASLLAENILDEIHAPPTYAPLCLHVIFQGKTRYNLSECDVHETILEAAGVACGLDFYSHDENFRFSEDSLEKMSAFVRELVNVDQDIWQQFLNEAHDMNAPDFICTLASWASYHSDQKARCVYLSDDMDDERHIIVRHNDLFGEYVRYTPVQPPLPAPKKQI